MNSYLFNKVGLWGYRHYEYLKQNQPTTINVMQMNGMLRICFFRQQNKWPSLKE